MISLYRRAYALAFLGVYFVRHWFLRARTLVKPLPPAKEQFLSNFAEDRILPVSRSQRERFFAQERCINCGVCDAEHDGFAAVKTRTGLAAPLVAISFSRSQPETWALEDILDAYPDLGKIENNCPRGVPLNDTFVLLRENLERMKKQAGGKVPKR